MLKRKEFILGAAVGLTFAAAATAGGIIDWPTAEAGPVAGVSGRLNPSAGAKGLAFAPPQGAPLSFADIFDQVSPAVVQIEVETRIERPQGGVFQIPGLPGFGFQAPPSAEGAEPPTQQGAGSGFFISADGFIVTNNHVVADATEITVKLSDERELKATLVGRDQGTDLAVLKVEGTDFPFVSFEESAEPRVGDWVLAVGNPFALGGTATAGIVSAKARDIDPRGYNDFIQIDAAINRGNSGGPTFDIYGRVIGVNSAIFSPSGGSVGIGFAIPAAVAKTVTDQLIRSGSVERGYLGVGVTTFDEDYVDATGVPEGTRGAYVSQVTEGGPADRAGVEVYDIVTAVNGEAVKTSSELTRLVGAAGAGDPIRLDILRDARRQTITVRSGTRPPESEIEGDADGGGAGVPPAAVPPAVATIEGMTLSPLTPALRTRLSLPDGVVGLIITDVSRTSEAAGKAIQPGLVIVAANARPVMTPAELNAVIADARRAGRGAIVLLLRQGSNTFTVALPLSDPE